MGRGRDKLSPRFRVFVRARAPTLFRILQDTSGNEDVLPRHAAGIHNEVLSVLVRLLFFFSRLASFRFFPLSYIYAVSTVKDSKCYPPCPSRILCPKWNPAYGCCSSARTLVQYLYAASALTLRNTRCFELKKKSQV